MSAPTNGIGWFQIGTDDPARAERFYGELFGWRVERSDADYREIDTAEGSIRGGLFNHRGQVPNHAIFFVVVPDVAATVKEAEARGGKVAVPRTETPDGLVFAELLDPSGNHFGVFTPTAR